MLEHPLLINRPIVVTPLVTKLCRPSETVLDILPAPQQGAFTKKDGELVVDSPDRRQKVVLTQGVSLGRWSASGCDG
jgi:arsenate reductase (glutaredoxin)